MRVERDLSRLGDGPGSVVTIGAYDGVHRGHQAVLRLVRELADARGLRAVLVTFDRHPAEVVRPNSAPRLLTTLEQRLELLEATGMLDLCVLLTFDDARRKEAAEEFVHEVLVDGLRTRMVVVGADFHFGHRRAGNVPLLDAMGSELGFEVLGLGLVAPTDTEGPDASPVPYSSTVVRVLLSEGDVVGAAAVLGRDYEVRGVVERGDGRGRGLGFPTANMAVPDRICLPADGVYAGTFIGPDRVERAAALSIGRRPTFYAEQGLLLLEAHVLDFDADLYGQAVAVRFRSRLRGQERFEDAGALVEAMRRDVEATRAALS